MTEAPLRMECYDVSHLSGTNIVASMVVFEDGLPRKDQYRRFSIADSTDDTESIYQTLSRRLAHLEDEPEHVTAALCEALAKLLPGPQPPQWRYASVHRWRYAQLANAAPGGLDCWWSKALGLGVCGDSFGNGSIEAAWRSGDELADAIAAAFDSAPERAVAPEPELADTAH